MRPPLRRCVASSSNARRKKTAKRGGGQADTEFQESQHFLLADDDQLLEVHAVLDELELEHPEQALHDLLKRGLDHVDEQGASLRAMKHFEHELARLLGIANHASQAASALTDTLGKLPKNREQLLKQLSNPPKKPLS